MNKPFTSIALLTFLFSALVFASINPGVVAASDASGRIEHDTTWTKTGSPYTLTGNLLVSTGATLTIEAGATVNLNGYLIMVNGTLKAQGSSAEKIQFNGGRIVFTDSASKWNPQTGVGCAIDYANLETTQIEISGGSPRLSHSSFFYVELNGNSTIFSNNLVTGTIHILDGSVKVTDNTINGRIGIGDGSPVISNNTVTDGIYGSNGSFFPQIINNSVTGGIHIPDRANSVLIENNTVWGETTISALNATLAHNTFYDQVSVSCAETHVSITLKENTINSSGIGISLKASPPIGSISALIESNSICSKNAGVFVASSFSSVIYVSSCDATLSRNRIFDCKVGILVEGADIYHDSININCNRIFNCTYAIQSSGVSIVDGNTLLNNYFGIQASNQAVIKNNIVSGNTNGVFGGNLSNNLIVNNKIGAAGNTINNNTIVHNSVGVAGFTKLSYNNIYDNTYNVNFTSSQDGDASYNWWGTTDAAAIGQLILDYEEDFMVGRVSYTPFLTALNKNAPSPDTEIPSIDSPIPTATPAPTSTTPVPTQTTMKTTNPTPSTTNPTNSASTAPQPTIPEFPIAAPLLITATAATLLAAATIAKVQRKQSRHNQ